MKSVFDNIDNTTRSFAIELNLPTHGGDLAAIIHAANITHIDPRQVVVFNKSTLQPRFISILSNQYEPLQYPLLFPNRDLGWHCNGDVSYDEGSL